jgi:hypothetical protein
MYISCNLIARNAHRPSPHPRAPVSLGSGTEVAGDLFLYLTPLLSTRQPRVPNPPCYPEIGRGEVPRRLANVTALSTFQAQKMHNLAQSPRFPSPAGFVPQKALRIPSNSAPKVPSLQNHTANSLNPNTKPQNWVRSAKSPWQARRVFQSTISTIPPPPTSPL